MKGKGTWKGLRWNHIRLRSKLMILYLAAVLLPVVFTNVTFYRMTAEKVQTQKLEDLHRGLTAGKDRFRGMLEGLIGFSSILYTDSLLSSALDHPYASEDEMLTAYNEIMSNAVNRFVPMNRQFYNAYLYTDNETLISSGVLKFLSEDTKREAWYRQIQQSTAVGELIIHTTIRACGGQESGPTGADCGRPYLSVIRKLDFFKAYSTYAKVLRIDILPEYLQSTLWDRSSPGEFYILNRDGAVVYASGDSPLLGEAEAQRQHKLVIASPFEGAKYLQGWRIVGIYPESQVLDAVLQSRKFIIYLTCVNLLVPTLIILLFSRSLTGRIGYLLKMIKRVKNQQFEPLNAKPAHDEIGQLTGEFSRMTEQIGTLIQDVYVAELDRRQAQFNALQSQINPHYLFNTLEAVRMNCIVNDEKVTADIIKRLARGFRRSLQWGDDRIPVSEEMEFVLDFLEIQKFRFGSHLNYYVHVDEDVRGVYIPKMSILPLVENACIHGIEKREGPGTVGVRVMGRPSCMLVEVSDSGAGMEEEDVEQWLEQMKHGDNRGDHVGLKNVYDRLKWHCGSAFDLSIQSAPGRGTLVRVRIPLDLAPGDREAEQETDGGNTAC
ncbi:MULTISPECIES: cache domain-containing sensor histidine kinase [Paenibacillus]|uniref:cache domain-containing sensor histidine kinase n=1 Tax=Paenibacillus TaxID=44249 RepID=UPI0022B87949|nr:sensor histidine kinase [Paenibacillus caseinilyticus]MCZ8520869.1 sensor histidine kinase [Paenibacillus caseinilyticus]